MVALVKYKTTIATATIDLCKDYRSTVKIPKDCA